MSKSETQSIVEIILGSAFQAFFVAIFAMIFLQFAMGLAGGILVDMVPAAPPGLPAGSGIEIGKTPPGMSQLKKLYDTYGFAICYGVLFVSLATFNATMATTNKPLRRVALRLRHVTKKLVDNWFQIVVGNAFVCFFSAMMFVVMQNISMFRWATDLMLTAIQPIFYRVANVFFDAEQMSTAKAFVGWYHANEMKLTFWVFYLSAVLDDFGLPNIKTLAKRLWRGTSRPPAENQKTSRNF